MAVAAPQLCKIKNRKHLWTLKWDNDLCLKCWASVHLQSCFIFYCSTKFTWHMKWKLSLTIFYLVFSVDNVSLVLVTLFWFFFYESLCGLALLALALFDFLLLLNAYSLNSGMKETPVLEVCETFKVARGMVQALQENAGRFASMVSVFCERLGWYDLEGLIAKFQNRVSFGVRAEIVELTTIPYVKVIVFFQTQLLLLRFGYTYLSVRCLLSRFGGSFIDNFDFIIVTIIIFVSFFSWFLGFSSKSTL